MVTFFVSPNGDPDGDGSRDRPFASITDAQVAVRDRIASGHRQSISVELGGGTYRINRTLVFTREDGFHDQVHAGERAATVTYRAAEGETPVISGGVPVGPWSEVKALPPGTPEDAAGSLYRTDNTALRTAKTLYDGTRRIPRSRTSGFEPRTDLDAETRSASELGTSRAVFDTIEFPSGAMRAYENLTDSELVVRPTQAWVVNILPLASVDVENGIARTTVPATYPMNRLAFRHAFKTGSQSACVENVFDGLSQGTWHGDTDANSIYLWPRTRNNSLGAPAQSPRSKSGPKEDVIVPCLTELVRVEGNEEGPVRGLVFDGITFAHTDRITWDLSTVGLQHDWDLYDAPNAMVRFRGAERCVVRNCTFTAGGGDAIRLDLHCIGNTVERNTITGIGGTGILLAGYGPGHRDENRENLVAGNTITRCGELFPMSPGIMVWQSGHNRIAHNFVSNVPYIGIVLSGPRYQFLLEPTDGREQFKTVDWEVIGDSVAHKHAEVLAEYERLPENTDRESISHRMSVFIEPYLHCRENVVEMNEVSNAILVLADGDAIYFSGTGKGNVVRHNFVHDVVSPGTMGHVIRMDGMQYWTLIEENVIHRSSGGISTRVLCDTINNVVSEMVFPLESESPRRRHTPFIAMSGSYGETRPRRIERNIYVQSDYVDDPIQYRAHGQFTGYWEDTVVDRNVYFCAPAADALQRILQENRSESGFDLNSIVADPMLRDPSKGDCRLADDSPARALGIKDVDLRQVGPRGWDTAGRAIGEDSED